MDNDIAQRFCPAAIKAMRDEIESSYGNEVFFAGTLDSNGIVSSVCVASRGTEKEVPINFFMAQDCDILIHNHPSGILRPSQADMNVAYALSQNGQGFYIVNNSVTCVYAVMEPAGTNEIKELDYEEAKSYLSSGGPLALQSKSFEERPSQMSLTQSVAKAFNESAIGVFEAGTGVGKSFAYLIPAMLWASQNKERVVISTGTINLQQQLMEKDIPAAEKIINKKLKAVLVKGRQNYVCLRRLSDAKADSDLFGNDEEALDGIRKWAEVSPTGSRSDLPFVPSESAWGRINSESEACMGPRCPHREKCFVMKVRKEAASANILVVNHHLLFADIESRMDGAGYDDAAVLPPYRRIIFDEAHNIENAATSFFSSGLTRFRMLKQLSMLYRQWRGTASGHIFVIQSLSKAEDHSQEIIAAIEEIKQCLENLENVSAAALGSESAMRLCSATVEKFTSIVCLLSKLGEKLSYISNAVHDIIENIDDSSKDIPQYWETRSVLRRIEDMALLCKKFASWKENTADVFWMQRLRLGASIKGAGQTFIQFVRTPLDIAPLMNNGIFEPMESVVCVSATLSIGGRFDHWIKQVGAHFTGTEHLLTESFPSPFPYKTNVLLAIPSDVPLPDRDGQAYRQYVNDAVVSLIKVSQGRTLVLFTSRDALENACSYARENIQDCGIKILKQGDDDRFRLLDLFKNDMASVLFATDSFWQGVDVPGESLSQVIIAKLPFRTPNDPVFEARSEIIAKKGGNAFMDLALPDAVIKFRQGFGRLVRRSSDRGDVVVLDRRIVERRYGKIFMDSIPPVRHFYCPLKEILRHLEDFF